MVTVPEATEDTIKRSPFLEEALSQGILNLSALAKELKPQLEEKLLKNVSPSSIMMALKRLEEKLKGKAPKTSILAISDITVRSNLIELVFSNSPTLLDKQQKLLSLSAEEKNIFVAFTRGVYETTIFASSYLEDEIKKQFFGEHLKKEFKNLSSISLILSEKTVKTPGVYFNILKIFAWQGINLIEVASSFTELTIFLDSKDIDKAFSTLKNLS
jgi:aspartokinase